MGEVYDDNSFYHSSLMTDSRIAMQNSSFTTEPSSSEAKPARKPKGPLKGHPSSSEVKPAHPSATLLTPQVDFTDLQRIIDSGQWKTDASFRDWIFEQYLQLIETGHIAPEDFATAEFMDEVWRVHFNGPEQDSQQQEEAADALDAAFDEFWGEDTPQPAPPPPFLAGIDDELYGKQPPHLVDYSDSEEENSQPNQRGGSNENASGNPQSPPPAAGQQHNPPAAPPPLPIEDYFDLSPPIRTYVKKYKVHGKAYWIRFKNTDKMSDLEGILTEIFRRVLEDAYEEANPTDMVGFQFRHWALRTGRYNVPFNKREEMTPERIFAILEKLLMSEEDLNVDEDMEIVVTRIPDIRGGRPKEHIWNHRAFMKKHCGHAHGGSFIQINNPNDDLCLARALVVAKARIDKETIPEVARQWETIRKGDKARCTLQKRLAQDLMNRAGLHDHQGPCGEEEIQKLQAVLEPEYQIKIFSAACCNFLTFQGKVPSEKVLHIYHDIDDEGEPGHFIVCTKPHVLFNAPYWCDKCNKGYKDKKEHKCHSKCYCCFSLKDCPLVDWMHCFDCNRWFKSQECFDKHKTVVQPRGENKRMRVNKSLCEKVRRCEECGRIVNFAKAKKVMFGNKLIALHHCGLVYCRHCDLEHPEGSHECYIQPIEDKNKKKASKKKPANQRTPLGEIQAEEQMELDEQDRDLLGILSDLAANNETGSEKGSETDINSVVGGEEENDDDELAEEVDDKGTKIFFDFECTQEKIIGENKLGPIFAHVPNLCVAVKVCNDCKDSARKREFGSCPNCGKGEWVFWGPNCRDDFCKWLFSEENRGAIAIAHNAKGYDSQFLIHYLIRETMVPKVITKGRELMMLEFGDIRVIDSLNFMPMGLADLPKAFGETELKKGYFPHKFNRDENQDYIGPYPEAHFYDPEYMKTPKRAAFYAWYTKQYGKEFNFKQEILAYCRSDVDILMKCCLKFEDLIEQKTGMKPFNVGITIASVCMHIFRKNFLKMTTIARIPHGGYRGKENQSLEGLRWLKWLSESQDIYIQHAGNGFEKRIGKYKVDGYHKETNTVYEFNGCIWHGHTCYKNRAQKVPNSAMTLEEAYQKCLSKRKDILDRGYNLVEMWECELRREKRLNPEMRRFFEEMEDLPQPLNMREALRGGRTNATRLYYKCKPGERMFYVDVVSLYPWGVKWTKFPVGHPKIITENFEPVSAGRNPYFGLFKCTVLPPRKLLHPVLPYKCNGKLLFPLCRTCAQTQHNGYCTHSDEERALTGEWVSTELDKSLQMGYKIMNITEIWHYEQTDQYDGKDPDTGLFTRYINCFLKMKIEASGWPEWVKTEADQEEFIRKCEEREGIQLDPANIEKNAGLRSLAKLCLNSFWGKFGQRSNMSKNEFVSEPSRFFDILFDETNIVESVEAVTEEMMYVTYKKDEEFVEPMAHMNPIIAAFTTANCRLRLYEELEKLEDRVCYMDTDSVIYLTRPGDIYHPKIGSFLGEMTNELEDYGDGAYICEFCSGGPKNYAYKILKPDGTTEAKVKIRGFTLNHHAASKLNMLNLKNKVFDFVKHGLKPKTTIVQPQIARTEKREVVTQDVAKDYGVCYDKRWVQQDFTTLPYGSCEE